jgi:hypothetical protein
LTGQRFGSFVLGIATVLLGIRVIGPYLFFAVNGKSASLRQDRVYWYDALWAQVLATEELAMFPGKNFQFRAIVAVNSGGI